MTENEQRAAEARQLKNNPLFTEIFDNVREALIGQIEAAPIDNPELRNELGLSLAMLAGVKSQVQGHIETAQLDADEENQKEFTE